MAHGLRMAKGLGVRRGAVLVQNAIRPLTNIGGHTRQP
jgi:hypothetical protein